MGLQVEPKFFAAAPTFCEWKIIAGKNSFTSNIELIFMDLFIYKIKYNSILICGK